MKNRAVILGVLVLLGAGFIVWWRVGRHLGGETAQRPAPVSGTEGGVTATPPDGGDPLRLKRPPKIATPAAGTRTAEEKAALVAKIRADYQEIVTQAAADFSAAGNSFPGGFNAYLRQLALLEREKWLDYAAVLSPRELEDLQFQEHHSGKLVAYRLGNTAATDEQRRQVLRLQRSFDDKYSLVFDFAVPALLQRETERQALQEQILGVLGEGMFASWLQGEGEDFGKLSAYVRQNGLRPEAAMEVWRLRNEFVRRRLELNAQGGPAGTLAASQTLLVEEYRTKLGLVIGPAGVAAGAAAGVGWLPAK